MSGPYVLESDHRELWERTPTWCRFPMMGRGGGLGGRFREDEEKGFDLLKMMRVAKNSIGTRRIKGGGEESHVME